jgi:hypothetical protein
MKIKKRNIIIIITIIMIIKIITIIIINRNWRLVLYWY